MLKVNDYVVQPTIFPDGTSQVWKLPQEVLDCDAPTITWIFDSEAEIFHLAQLVELFSSVNDYLSLWVPYLPYGRQDKAISNDSTFALHVLADMLNNMTYIAQVSSFDPHSDIALDAIWGFTAVRADSLISSIAADFDYVCFPDAGAAKRYHIPSKPAIIARKVRDQSNGRIVLYELESGVQPERDSRVLIVDDICDGGATFVKLGEVLQAYKVRASLYVSHGIFSKGLEPLKPYYERIYTTDSRPTKHKELVVYESAPTHRLLQG